MTTRIQRQKTVQERIVALSNPIRSNALEVHALLRRIEWCNTWVVLSGMVAIIPGVFAVFWFREALRAHPATALFFTGELANITGLLAVIIGSWIAGSFFAGICYFFGERSDAVDDLRDMIRGDTTAAARAYKAVKEIDPMLVRNLEPWIRIIEREGLS